MKLQLICSGLSHLPRLPEDGSNEGGCRLPRVLLARNNQQFLPDYALLLLADEILMDRMTFEGLIRGQIQSGPTVALMAKLLHQEGFLRLEDFAVTVQARESQLAALIKADLGSLESWVPAVQEWFATWQAHFQGIQATLRPAIKQMREDAAAGRPAEMDYSHQASKFIHDTGGRYQMVNYYAEEALATEESGLDDHRRAELRTLLEDQLHFARGNLLLCQQFGAGLHDWCDFHPLYQEITARAGQGDEDGKPAQTAQPLFELPLPEFTFWHPDNVLRALNDPRVRQLRERVGESIATGKPLNDKAAGEILPAIARLDKGVTGIRLVTATIIAAPKSRGRQTGEVSSGDAVSTDSFPLLTSRSRDARQPDKTVG